MFITDDTSAVVLTSFVYYRTTGADLAASVSTVGLLCHTSAGILLKNKPFIS